MSLINTKVCKLQAHEVVQMALNFVNLRWPILETKNVEGLRFYTKNSKQEFFLEEVIYIRINSLEPFTLISFSLDSW